MNEITITEICDEAGGDFQTDWKRLVVRAKEVERERDEARAEVARLRAAADPFVRATLMQEPLNLPDSMPVRDFLPAWPTMSEARTLVAAVKGETK